MAGLDHVLDRLERLIDHYFDALATGAGAKVLSQVFSEISSILADFKQSSVGQTFGTALSDHLSQFLGRLAQDPFLTGRAAEYLRTRILAIEGVATELQALASELERQHVEHDHNLPSGVETTQDQIVERARFLTRLLDATAECMLIHQLIPSPCAVLNSVMPGHTVDTAANAGFERTPYGIVDAHTPLLPAAGGLLAIEPHVHLTHRGKARHVADAAQAFAARLRKAAQQHRTDIDRAGAYGVYDPVNLRCVAASLLDDTVDRATLTCKDLIALAETPVGLHHMLSSRQQIAT